MKDTGVGIKKSELPKLFTRFAKLMRTAELNNEGIGLGLTIVRAIVAQADGDVVALSEGEGNGSLFCFSMRMPASPLGTEELDLTSFMLTHEAEVEHHEFDS